MSRIYDPVIAVEVAHHLLDIKAVKLSPNEPFTWSSGWKSPIYCDNRKVQSYPKISTIISGHLKDAINKNFPTTKIIASVATGAIPHGVLTADKMQLPHVYINKKAKEHGLGRLIEGVYQEGDETTIVEDLFSTGKSSLIAAKTAQDEKLDVVGMIGIVTYGFPQVDEVFAAEKFEIVTLTSYDYILQAGLECGIILEEQLPLLSQWRRDPANWAGPV